MKLKIKCIQNPFWVASVWEVSFNGKVEQFNNPTAAYEYAKKAFKRYYKEQSAWSMARTIAVNLLNQRDEEFLIKIMSNKCKGITKGQYGYLKGIHERQEREW